MMLVTAIMRMRKDGVDDDDDDNDGARKPSLVQTLEPEW